MKYLKLFEVNEYSSPPLYKIGDYVRIINGANYIYEIKSVSYTQGKYTYYLASTIYPNSYLSWYEENRLILVPEYQINANKYNL